VEWKEECVARGRGREEVMKINKEKCVYVRSHGAPSILLCPLYCFLFRVVFLPTDMPLWPHVLLAFYQRAG